MLSISSDIWPVYAAHIVLEFARDMDTGTRYVRLLYNFDEKVIAGAPSAWVTYDHFEKHVRTYIPNDYYASCNAAAGAVGEEHLQEEIPTFLIN